MRFSEAMQDKKFLKWMFTLSLPIAMQNLINASVNTADTIMVGQLGEASIGICWPRQSGVFYSFADSFWCRQRL